MEAMSVAGGSDRCRAALLTRLIPALEARDLSVATVKFGRRAIDRDRVGRYPIAADMQAFSRRGWRLNVRRDKADAAFYLESLLRQLPAGSLLRQLPAVDLVLVEGLESPLMRRIEILCGRDSSPIHQMGLQSPIAVITDGPGDVDVAAFRRDEVEPLADFIWDAVEAKQLIW